MDIIEFGINEEVIRVDSIAMLMEYVDISEEKATELITQYEVDVIVEKMCEAQALQISKIAQCYRNGEL